MKISKPSILMILVMAILLAFSSLTGCTSTQTAKTSGAVETTDSAVRVPPGDPTAFWDEMGWTELNDAEQAAWGVLGWDEAAWEGEAKKPPSEDKYWNQLSDEERDACKTLGYNKELWDNS